MMSRVPQKNTSFEQIVCSFLHKQGFRFRKNVKTLPGSPDIVLPKYRTAIFVHGCFWHGHKGCKAAKLPSTRQEYWVPKINANIKRDRRKKEALQKEHWRVLVIWQCQIKNKASQEKQLVRLVQKIIK